MDEGKTLDGGAVRAVGCMSGTSLDGVDAAVLETDGIDILGFGPVSYRGYGPDEQAVLRAALGAWPGDPGVDAAAAVVTAAHAEVLQGFDAPDLIGFHGQTLAHDPHGRGTHQAGDAATLAAALNRPVVWDFRSADVAAGGEGAPLAPVYHWALSRWIGARDAQAFLNLGGVGNLTWVDPLADDPFGPGAMLAFDTGPANAPLNDLMMRRRGVPQDEGGALALAGHAKMAVVEEILAHRFFQTSPPKSLDRDAFSQLGQEVSGLHIEDATATLVRVLAESVAAGMMWCPSMPARVLVAGGGRHNAAIMAALSEVLPCEVAPVETVGLDGDMLEAQAFAYLAVRSLRGLPLSGPSTTGVATPQSGGQVVFP